MTCVEPYQSSQHVITPVNGNVSVSGQGWSQASPGIQCEQVWQNTEVPLYPSAESAPGSSSAAVFLGVLELVPILSSSPGKKEWGASVSCPAYPRWHPLQL